jgi:foldase protein PrsA
MTRRIAALALLALLTGCGNLLEPAAAVVSGEKITIDKVEDELERFRQTQRYELLVNQANPSQIERGAQQAYLTELIQETVLDEKAEELDLEVTPEEVNQRIDELVQEEYGGSEAQFQEALREEGLDREGVELQIRIQLLEVELYEKVTSDIGPTEEDVRTYYEEHIKDFQEVRAEHILVGKPGLAQDLAVRLQPAGAKKVDKLFASLARKHSEDPISRKEGGDLGWGLPASFPFGKAATQLQVGQVSDPIKTRFGFHIVRVTGRRLTPLERARDVIEQRLREPARQEAWADWLRDAYEDAEIRVNSRFGEFHLDTFTVGNATAEDVPAGEAPVETSPAPTP